MPRKRLIVYDLDGTLVDTAQDITDAVNHMLAALGRPGMAPAQVQGYVGRGVVELIRSCLDTDDQARLNRGLELYRARYGAHLLDHSTLYPGVREVLAHFRDRRQAVITNKPNPDSRRILEGLGVADCFVDIIGGNSGFPKKPDPSSLRALLTREACAPGEAVYVGDSPTDVATGRQAGVFAVVVEHGFTPAAALRKAGADLIVRDFAEFLHTARREGW